MKQKPPTREQFGLRETEVIQRLGSDKLFREMRAAGWLKPVIHRHKLTLYNAADVAIAWSRVVAGEQPNPKQEALTA